MRQLIHSRLIALRKFSCKAEINFEASVYLGATLHLNYLKISQNIKHATVSLYLNDFLGKYTYNFCPVAMINECYKRNGLNFHFLC